MYKPIGSRTLAEVIEQQIRLGIQGYGGTGKSTSAVGVAKGAGFPNPVVVNVDRGLGAFTGREDVIEIPLYSDEYCKKINPNHKGPTTLCDTIRIFLDKEAKKLEADQTLVWDGNTGMQNAYHKWYTVNKVYSPKTGKEESWAEWNLKLQFYNDVMEIFKTLKCHIVFIAHEMDKKDQDGSYSGKIRPLLSGSFNDQIMTHFTDWVRQRTKDKPKDYSKLDKKELDLWGFKEPIEYEEMCAQFPRNTIYYWQLESDDIFDGKISSLVNFPRFIPATYKSFKSFMKNGTANINNLSIAGNTGAS